MELKPGYKETEVGVIPEEWESASVRRIASCARSAIVGGPFGSDLVSSDYVDRGVPVIRGQNMNGRAVSGTFVFVTSTKAMALEANLARPGDVIFTQRGTLGQVSLVPESPYDCYLVSQSQMKVTLNREAADPLFFYYVFSSAEKQRYLRQNTIQTGVPHINLGILRGIPVQRPPLPEQRAIAGALGDVDALLGVLEKLIAKKRDLKQAAMQQLLTGKTRLPGFHGEWEVEQLGDVAEIVSGGTPRTTIPAYWNGGIRWCTPTDITRAPGKYLSETERTVSQLGLESCSARLLPAGALLLCSRATIGEVKIAACQVSTNQGFKSLIIRDGICNEFLYYRLLTMKPQMVERAIGSTFLEISKKDTASLEVALPLFAEQTAIAGVLSDMDAEIAALEARLAKTRALKQGMMQELLTGRIRLV
jgi:type I restriction enzyme, S subunit